MFPQRYTLPSDEVCCLNKKDLLHLKIEYIHPDNNFRLVDKNGRDYSFVWAEGEGSIEGILAPGRKITGEQSYGIPKDINEYELEVFNYGAVESEVAIVEISIIQ